MIHKVFDMEPPMETMVLLDHRFSYDDGGNTKIVMVCYKHARFKDIIEKRTLRLRGAGDTDRLGIWTHHDSAKSLH